MNRLCVDLVSIYSVGLFGRKNTTFYAADCENLEFSKSFERCEKIYVHEKFKQISIGRKPGNNINAVPCFYYGSAQRVIVCHATGSAGRDCRRRV